MGLGEVLVGDGNGVGATGVLADATARARCRGLSEPLGLALAVAPVLLAGTDPVPKDAATSWCPGPPLARATATSVARMTAAAEMPATTCPCRARHHGDLGGSSGLGKP